MNILYTHINLFAATIYYYNTQITIQTKPCLIKPNIFIPKNSQSNRNVTTQLKLHLKAPKFLHIHIKTYIASLVLYLVQKRETRHYKTQGTSYNFLNHKQYGKYSSKTSTLIHSQIKLNKFFTFLFFRTHETFLALFNYPSSNV